jgi:4a-hydroxytetrahydrobiopterin dehydratase
MPVLSQSQIEDFTKAESGWKLEEGKLVRDYSFADFAAAIAFVDSIAKLAESADHHPDIDIRYNKVRLGLISHDTGGITERDTRMASRISHHFD